MRPLADSVRSCPACGHSAHRLLTRYTRTRWPVVACGHCAFVFLGRVPGYQALVSEYSWDKTFAAEKKRRKASWIGKLDTVTRFRTMFGHRQDRDRIERIAGNTARVLEIGCGESNRIPDVAIPYGIEISEALAKRAHAQFAARGGKVVHAPALLGMDEFPDNFFDVILMRSYLEHEEHPGPVLAKAHRILRQGSGVIYVRVPNYGSINRLVTGKRWCGFRFPDHVNYFTSASLRKMAAEHGFSFRRLNPLSIFDDNLIAVLTR